MSQRQATAAFFLITLSASVEGRNEGIIIVLVVVVTNRNGQRQRLEKLPCACGGKRVTGRSQ